MVQPSISVSSTYVPNKVCPTKLQEQDSQLHNLSRLSEEVGNILCQWGNVLSEGGRIYEGTKMLQKFLGWKKS